MGIKASITPIKNLRVYGIYSFNENRTLNEKRKEDMTPDGKGFQVGVESYIPSKKGHFHIWGEYYYAMPYLYIKENHNISFAKVFQEIVQESGNHYQWMGSPFGPDSMSFELFCGYENPKKWSINASYTWAALGEYSGLKIFKDVNLLLIVQLTI